MSELTTCPRLGEDYWSRGHAGTVFALLHWCVQKSRGLCRLKHSDLRLSQVKREDDCRFHFKSENKLRRS